MHSILRTRIEIRQPPDSLLKSKANRKTYKKLKAQGDSHLNAIHKIASVIAENLWDIMNYGKEFNEKKYIRQLKRITKH